MSRLSIHCAPRNSILTIPRYQNLEKTRKKNRSRAGLSGPPARSPIHTAGTRWVGFHFMLPADAGDTNPKRKRGHQTIPSLALRKNEDWLRGACPFSTSGANWRTDCNQQVRAPATSGFIRRFRRFPQIPKTSGWARLNLRKSAKSADPGKQSQPGRNTDAKKGAKDGKKHDKVPKRGHERGAKGRRQHVPRLARSGRGTRQHA